MKKYVVTVLLLLFMLSPLLVGCEEDAEYLKFYDDVRTEILTSGDYYTQEEVDAIVDDLQEQIDALKEQLEPQPIPLIEENPLLTA